MVSLVFHHAATTVFYPKEPQYIVFCVSLDVYIWYARKHVNASERFMFLITENYLRELFHRRNRNVKVPGEAGSDARVTGSDLREAGSDAREAGPDACATDLDACSGQKPQREARWRTRRQSHKDARYVARR